MTSLVPSDSLRSFLEQASTRYQESLKGSPAETYLVEKRGLDNEVIERFSLGYVDVPLPGHEKYQGYLAIPYLTPDGSLTSIRFRRLGGDGPKYLTVSGDMPRLYNAPALVQPYTGVCITEGEIDAITAEQCGLPAVGVPGATSWQSIWYLLFKQYDVVFVLTDDDKAGAEFGQAVSRGLETARVIPMTGGDVNSFVREHGADALRRKLNARVIQGSIL
ncbi:toprim domain-containing protein [Streptosporangium canum]|uniref:toprim domain-containing protein n=1 Tax=Streptosporangium canum TaxID=324952 RepID=UPI0033B897B3